MSKRALDDRPGLAGRSARRGWPVPGVDTAARRRAVARQHPPAERPSNPSYHNTDGSVWTITPALRPHIKWTTGERCLNHEVGGYSTWTESLKHPDPDTA